MIKKMLIVLASVLVATAVFAQTPRHEALAYDVAVDPAPEAVGDVLAFTPHVGSSPLAGTQILTTGEWDVCDLFTGFCHRYTETLGFVGSFAHPFGAATTTGVTFNEASGNSLYVFTASGDTCIEVDLTYGVIGGAFSLANPNAGLLAGLSYDAFGTDGNPSFWYVDIVSDTVVESDINGILKSTHPQPNGGGGFGNGTDATNCGGAPDPADGLDTLAGLGSAGMTTEAAWTDQAGTVRGITSVAATGDTFVNDVVRTLDYNNTGVEAVMLVGNASNTLFIVEAFLSGCGGPDDGGTDDGGDDGGDGGVPATTGIGVALTVLALLGSSAYFMRRKN